MDRFRTFMQAVLRISPQERAKARLDHARRQLEDAEAAVHFWRNQVQLARVKVRLFHCPPQKLE